MKLRLKNTIEDFNDHQYWGIKKSIKEGFIGFSPNSSILKIVDSNNFTTIAEVEYPSNLMFYFSNNELKYVLNENEIHVLNLESSNTSKVYHGEKSNNIYLAFLSDNIILEDVRIKEKRKLISKTTQIINIENSEVLALFDDDFEFIKLYDDKALFYHPKSHILESRCLNQNRTLWQIQLDGEPWIDYSLFKSNDLFLLVNTSSLKYELHKIDLTTGGIAWSLKDVSETTHWYDETLVQFGGTVLKIYDSKTGVLKENKEIIEFKDNGLNVSSNLADLENNALYYTTSIGTGVDKRALLGIINLENFKSDLYEIPFDSNIVDIRSPIGRPFVNNKDIFIEIEKKLRKYSLE